MRKFFTVCLPIAVLLFSNGAAPAETLDFSLTGQGQTLTFSLSSSPTLSTSYAGGFTVANISYVLNSTAGTTDFGFDNENAQFFFGASAVAQQGTDTFGTPGDAFQGDHLFTGAGTSPVFKTGTFNESDPFADSLPKGEYSMTITAESTPAVPEPSSLLLLGTGTSGLLGMAKRLKARR